MHVFFCFNRYSHATYLDHGEIMYSPFPVRCPLSAVSAVAACCKLPFALRPGRSQKDEMRTKEITKERVRASVRDKRNKQSGSAARHLVLIYGCREKGVGRNRGSYFPAPPRHSAPPPSTPSRLPALGAPEPPFRRLAPCIPLSQHSPPHICGGEEV